MENQKKILFSASIGIQKNGKLIVLHFKFIKQDFLVSHCNALKTIRIIDFIILFSLLLLCKHTKINNPEMKISNIKKKTI